MSLITPGFGLLVWMLIIFGLVFILLAKFGFPAITGMVEKRNAHISEALHGAKEAEDRLKNLADEQKKLLIQTKLEQDRMINETSELRKKIIEQAKEDAAVEAGKLIEKAKKEIAAEKESALRDTRKQMAILSIAVAEKIVRKELGSDSSKLNYVDTLVDEISARDNSDLVS